jgi:hypothetical protein
VEVRCRYVSFAVMVFVEFTPVCTVMLAMISMPWATSVRVCDAHVSGDDDDDVDDDDVGGDEDTNNAASLSLPSPLARRLRCRCCCASPTSLTFHTCTANLTGSVSEFKRWYGIVRGLMVVMVLLVVTMS